MVGADTLIGFLIALPFAYALGYWLGGRAERKATEFVRNEVRFLRGQMVERHDHERRVDRVASGLSELAPEKPEEIVVPEQVQILCGLFSGSTATALLKEAKRMKVAGMGWPQIERHMRDSIDAQAPGLLADIAPEAAAGAN